MKLKYAIDSLYALTPFDLMVYENAQLMEENAKLRELVRELWELYADHPCEECPFKDKPICADCPICARETLVIARMRELGIEVD